MFVEYLSDKKLMYKDLQKKGFLKYLLYTS